MTINTFDPRKFVHQLKETIVKNSNNALDALADELGVQIETSEVLSRVLRQILYACQSDKSWPWEAGKPVGINKLRDRGHALAVGYNRLQSRLKVALLRRERGQCNKLSSSSNDHAVTRHENTVIQNELLYCLEYCTTEELHSVMVAVIALLSRIMINM